MIKLDNVTLRVKQIRGGRYGDFCVGELFHECCELKVKDSLLDQFEEGEYHGTVWISKIHMYQYIAYGKAVTEMRATLHDMQLESAFDVPAEDEPAEPDPLLESPPPAPAWQAQVPMPTPPLPAASSTGLREQLRARISRVGRGSSDDTTEAAPDTAPTAPPALPEVLQEYWEQILSRQPVKLDPTVDRSLFREQSKALGQLGTYKFGFQDQTWYPM